ncbi:hypothetical protein F52700_5191 [Fusarium sp. NRRL 52700]|nr:hypothetical protein F52700_5191 [Fusarium sp. NRRL 52700]
MVFQVEKSGLSLFTSALPTGPAQSHAKVVMSTGGETAKAISIISLSPGVKWVFTRNELEKTLKQFEAWNNDLERLIAPLLDGFGFYRNKDLQKRLRPEGEVNIFQGHLDLNNLAISPNISLKDTKSISDNLITWDLVQRKIAEPRILVEYKRIPTQPNTTNEGDSSNASDTQPIKELYGSKLAQLLRTAGKHSFHTLPFNSYACDSTNAEYAFLFDYSPGTSTHKPKSLNDFILSGEDGSGFKLELK